jgi:hypothetical protein
VVLDRLADPAGFNRLARAWEVVMLAWPASTQRWCRRPYQAKRDGWAYGGPTVEQLQERLACGVQRPGGIGHSKPKQLQAKLSNHLARMGRTTHNHNPRFLSIWIAMSFLTITRNVALCIGAVLLTSSLSAGKR